ncbi:putative transcription factor C2H2 family [Helianthus anomalus]
MSDSHEMSRCKGCGKFMKASANSTLKKHTEKHCPLTKAKKVKRVKPQGPARLKFRCFM